MKHYYRVLGGLIGFGLVAYFVYFAITAFDTVDLTPLLRPSVIGAIAAAALLYGFIVPSSAYAWRHMLANAPGDWHTRKLCGILGATQLAKYLPGNVAQHASRTALALAYGMRWRDLIATTAIETLLTILAALIVGMACVTVSDHTFSTIPQLAAAAPWVAVALTAGVLALPLVIKAAMVVVRRFRRLSFLTMFLEVAPKQHGQLIAFGCYCFNYLLVGAGFVLIAKAMGFSEQLHYLQLTAAFALSWLAGFLAPGMPAGMGVREGTMALILVGTAEHSDVLNAILGMRLATVGGDLAWFALAAFLLHGPRWSRADG